MKRGISIFLITILLGTVSFAQSSKGLVKFFVDNENGYFEVLVNDTLLIKSFRDSLPAGAYSAKIWSYGYDVNDVTFTIQAGEVTEVHTKLNRSQDYLNYETAYHDYRMSFHKSVTIPVSATLSTGILSGIFLIQGKKLSQTINDDIQNYSQTPQAEEIQTLKIQVDENLKKYNGARYGYYISTGLFGIGILTSTYLAIRFKRNFTEPQYTKQSPFLTKSSWYYTGNSVGFIYRIG